MFIYKHDEYKMKVEIAQECSILDHDEMNRHVSRRKNYSLGDQEHRIYQAGLEKLFSVYFPGFTEILQIVAYFSLYIFIN